MLLLAEETPENFFPLTATRATFELRFGAMSLLERALQTTKDVVLRCRPEIADDVRARTGLRVNEDANDDIEYSNQFTLPYATAWEILSHSDQLIIDDYPQWRERLNCRDTALMNGAYVVGSPSDVHIGAESVVQPGCVLDASNGPIMIGERVQVKFSQIQGPVFIGNDCVIDGARLRKGASLGAHCKIGGEVSASIFQGRANKAHEGFVGNSWIGEWVNFGALATTSNLKNTYGTIRYTRDSKTRIDTKIQFLGSLMGDHAKIGIGQMLTTGSNIGVGCNIFGGGVAPSYVPAFCWGGVAGWSEYRWNDFLRVTEAVLARRGQQLSESSRALLHMIFTQTHEERRLLAQATSTR